MLLCHPACAATGWGAAAQMCTRCKVGGRLGQGQNLPISGLLARAETIHTSLRRAWDPSQDQPVAAQPLLEYVTKKMQDEETTARRIYRRPQSARTVAYCMSASWGLLVLAAWGLPY
jgi:hypothetical protein